LLKPRRLREGSVVAIVSPSWGGPQVFPAVFDKGLEVLRENFGLEIKEMSYTRASHTYLRRHPQLRAMDINQAFEDPDVDGIIASVGGEDSIRTLPYLDMELILDNPKIMMGFSDTTTILAHLCVNQMVAYYGPSVMAGFAQMPNYPAQLEHVRKMLFDPPDEYTYAPAPCFNEGYPDWAEEKYVGKVKRKKRSGGWKSLQGDKKTTGRLFGGCVEVLEVMKRTRFWPAKEYWNGKILFLETSEMMPTPRAIKLMLRNYGRIGVFDELNGVLLARPRGYSKEQKMELEKSVLTVISEEHGRDDIPILSNLDFGHTDPQMILPLGLEAEIDPQNVMLTLLERPVE
jgi:muramoyltetrapeptide carboxypeptidase LdcA involved in peptidoglycan recycling